jgi:phosphatidylglycerol:prolipoprotein diacylglycerol transferase
MSFHGGTIGLTLALAWFARANQRSFLEVADYLVPVVPIGLGLGRVANFVNQELWGAATLMPWGVLFTNPAAGGIARHPTQLYEALLEGLVLFLILNWVARKPRPHGTLMACFLIFYAIFRFAVEFVREPDAQLGYLAFDWLTMGQLLSVPMFVIGLIMLATVAQRRE